MRPFDGGRGPRHAAPRARIPARVSLALALVLLASVAFGARPAQAAELSVKYRSAANVYLDGGRAQGLSVGDRLLVMAGRQQVAELEVAFVAEHSASCRVISESRAVRAGDRVVPRLEPRVESPAATAPGSGAGPGESSAPAEAAAGEPGSGAARPMAVGAATSGAARPWARVRGGVSVGYYRVDDDTASAFDFQQRTARVDLVASELDGRPLTLRARLRSRQDSRARSLSSLGGRDPRQDRLYELSLRYDPPDGALAVELGRVGVSRFVGLGYLDGVLARWRMGPDWALGAFGGRSADVDGLGLSGSGAKYGAFVRLAPGGRWSRSYEAQLALVRERAEGDVSREYVSLESRFGSGSRWSLFQRAEIDLNSGWRETLAEKRYQLSTFSLAGHLRLSPSASASLSYDSRRNYRTFLNRSVPENVFDELLRQGLRGQLHLGRGDGWSGSVHGGLRWREGDTNAWSGGGAVRRGALFGHDVYLGGDASAFTSSFGKGLLASARAGKRFAAGHSLELSYTRSRYETNADMSGAAAASDARVTQWLRLSGRAELGRGVYAVCDLELDRGDDLQGTRALFEFGYRF